jgi:hypothetical protein
MDFSTSLTTLDTILGDAANTTFSVAEKTRAMTRAWNDSFVVKRLVDSSLSYTQGAYRYAIPAALTTIHDILISPTGSAQPFPEPISNDLYEVVNGYIEFAQRADYVIPNGYTLYLRGNYKFTTTDSLPKVNLQEYVLALAGVNTLTLLTHKKANLFIKNDTSMGELIGLRRELMNDVKELRNRLPKHYESA